ncbi:broad specificity phosphatase PhoE [Cupriavidus metallidurans]|mgnify:CR=1 FL=1|jgi:broad specificity phosphatase PhoE|nr:hypothetical protein AU374_01690 [Cupriavidus metallidurans]
MALFGVGDIVGKLIVTEMQLRRVHRVLRVATPFEGMSGVLRAAVTAAARAMAARDARRVGVVDLKRRGGGDFEGEPLERTMELRDERNTTD